MKILLLNGTYGNKYNEFLNHLSEIYHHNDDDVTVVNLEQLKITYCTGCFSCWIKTPGHCCHNDDIVDIHKLVMASDALITFTENTLGYTTSLTKKVQDKFIPLIHPYIELFNGESHHVKRYPKYPKLGLIFMDALLQEEDFQLTKQIYQRFALNFHSPLAMTLHSNGNLEEVRYEDISF